MPFHNKIIFLNCWGRSCTLPLAATSDLLWICFMMGCHTPCVHVRAHTHTHTHGPLMMHDASDPKGETILILHF